ncbi:MAG: hypothetical protein LBV08_10865 [Clostridiales bacterium]|jgi:hypothetical protein|nr:hypothetical protein [Clostridiales bacterium]
MYKVAHFDKEEKYIYDFLGLPEKLYRPKELTQNRQEVQALLLGRHILSKYFKTEKIVVYDGTGNTSARCMLTIYPGDSTLYIGFFECINDKKCASTLFGWVESYARSHNFKNITGPVDASFWVKYRLKTNMFDKPPYLSEPYNKDYYLNLFLGSKYTIKEKYVSNIFYKLPLIKYEKQKYKRRYEEFTRRGYKIISPKRKDFNVAIRQIYKLIMNLYSDFPIFKYISEEDFCQHFKYFKDILDMSMIKTAYYKGEMAGFFIGAPDYGNSLYFKLNLASYIKIFLKRLRSKNYVMLYMGVDKAHQGLGKALVQTVIKNIHSKHSTAVGAFIQKGKITETYAEDSIASKYEYALLIREL